MNKFELLLYLRAAVAAAMEKLLSQKAKRIMDYALDD
jgi:hypothetical protein